jgi:tetraprenyl-beta-curcumene synthase
VLSALAVYKRAVLPQVQDELRGWERRATAIPDPALREAALSALREKGSNAEATAVFGILAPRAQRPRALHAMTALQTAIDYLDTLGEQPGQEPLADGLALHGALLEAVTPGATFSDWYQLHPQSEDGGYLAELVTACQGEIAALPASGAVLTPAQRAARRCGEGQSHTHAAAGSESGAQQLKSWTGELDGQGKYLWWELAAGASSSVAIHALIAAAASPETGAEEAELIDAAYFPSIGALTVLLDDLVDRAEDAGAGEHSYLDYYPSNEIAAERLALLTTRAKDAVAALRHGQRHHAILIGVGAFYLSAPSARSDYARPIRDCILKALGMAVYPILFSMRALRRG